jgi:hypothetical protein
MGDDLMPEEVEIDPLGRGSAFRTFQNAAVETSRSVKVMNRKGKMKTGAITHEDHPADSGGT